jgi:hypothetical protein
MKILTRRLGRMSSRQRRKIPVQDQVDGGEEVCFGRCHCDLCGEGRRAEEKRKRRVTSPPAVATPTISTPRSREVGSEDEEEEKEKDEAVEELLVPEDEAVERPESPAAKRQRELVQKTSEEAL